MKGMSTETVEKYRTELLAMLDDATLYHYDKGALFGYPIREVNSLDKPRLISAAQALASFGEAIKLLTDGPAIKALAKQYRHEQREKELNRRGLYRKGKG